MPIKRKPAPYKLCPDCDQPMLPKGEVKKPNEYDHAQGCPRARKPAPAKGPTDTERIDWLEKQMSAQHGSRWPTFDPPSMDPMCDWKWFSGDDGPFETMRAAIDAAMSAKEKR